MTRRVQMDDDQVKNAMSEIRSQLSSASPAELTRLSIAVGGLLNSAISPEMESQVKELQAVVEKKSEEAELALSSKNISSNEERGQSGGDKDLDLIAAINDKIYDAFTANHEERLAKKKEETQNLSEALEATKAGRPISEELRQKLKKDPKEKEAEKEHNRKMAEAYKAAKAEKESHAAEIEKLKSEMAKSPHGPERQALQKRIEHHEARHEVAGGVMDKVHDHLDEHLAHAELIQSGKKAAQDKGVGHELWQEKQRDYHDVILAGAGKDLLLERAQEYAQSKDPDTVKSLLDFLGGQKSAADGIKEALDKTKKGDVPSSGPLRPSSTPNVKDPKGTGGPGI